jgi:GR25 family glycosyltransferase involved in LPS biosynthesis
MIDYVTTNAAYCLSRCAAEYFVVLSSRQFRARLDSRLSQPVSGYSVQHLNAALLIHRKKQFRPKFIAHSGANRQ